MAAQRSCSFISRLPGSLSSLTLETLSSPLLSCTAHIFGQPSPAVTSPHAPPSQCACSSDAEPIQTTFRSSPSYCTAHLVRSSEDAGARQRPSHIWPTFKHKTAARSCHKLPEKGRLNMQLAFHLSMSKAYRAVEWMPSF